MLPELNATRQTLQSTNSGYNRMGYETGNSFKGKQGPASPSMSSVSVKGAQPYRNNTAGAGAGSRAPKPITSQRVAEARARLNNLGF